MHFSVLKWALVIGVVYLLYAFARDQGLPEEQRMAQLERRVAVLEMQMKAQHLVHPDKAHAAPAAQ